MEEEEKQRPAKMNFYQLKKGSSRGSSFSADLKRDSMEEDSFEMMLDKDDSKGKPAAAQQESQVLLNRAEEQTQQGSRYKRHHNVSNLEVAKTPDQSSRSGSNQRKRGHNHQRRLSSVQRGYASQKSCVE